MLVALLTLCVPVLASCSSDSGSSTGDTRIAGPDFGQIPRFPGSHVVQKATTKKRVTTASFEVRGRTGKDIIDWYANNLPSGWTRSGRVRQIGPDAYRAAWLNGLQRLEVSTERAPHLDANTSAGPIVIQYDLVLRGGGA